MNYNEFYHHRISSEKLTVDINEIFRYLGYPKSKIKEVSETTDILKRIDDSISMIKKEILPQGIYTRVKITSTEKEKSEGIIKFADVKFVSNDLAKNLSRCNDLIIVASTIGTGADMLIKKFSKIDSAQAAILQATGSMFIESYMDILNSQITDELKNFDAKTHPRFSPGYGDLSLQIQKEIFRILPCTQKIGLTLMETCIMAPEKSITAFIGIEEKQNEKK